MAAHRAYALTAQVELRAGAARATLLPAIGGAVGGWSWHDIAVLRPMSDAAVTARDVHLAAAYPLVPYSNRIRDASLTAGSSRHALRRNFGDDPHAIHGIGWQRAWAVAYADKGHARLALSHDARDVAGDAATAWPWSFAATQAFALHDRGNGATLATTLTLCNTGTQAFPFGLGWHPYFPRSPSTTLRFDAAGIWHNDAAQLPVAHKPVGSPLDFTAARTLDDTPIDNVFTGWRGTAVLADAATHRRTTIDADSACSRLVVYAPPGRDYLAVEPVTHQTDAFNRSALGHADTGTRWLPPGAGFSCTMRITVGYLL